MPADHRERLAGIRRFDQLVAYLRDELDWPIDSDDFDEVTFDYTPEELGIDARNAAKVQEIKRLRPLAPGQPWGVFFVKFAPKRLPVVALRRILGQVTLRKRASADRAERQAWATDDLLFISNYGDGEARQIAFAHFSKPREGRDLPTLKVLTWDDKDTRLRLAEVVRVLRKHLVWPEDDRDAEAWRDQWRAAFTLRHREVITTSKQLSARLAELAKAIRDRAMAVLSIENESGRLTQLMEAFRDTLVHDLDEDGFADMYAQTIAYGLLSARITDPGQATADDFASHMRTNPFLRALLASFLKVGGRRGAGGPHLDFDELGVSEVVELLDDAIMEDVVRDFGDRNPQEDPVIHFYEHFLADYDKKKKVERGVFYTPRPVVSFIVRSVDGLLRREFGLADGLADTTTWGEMAQRHDGLAIPEGTPPDQAFIQLLDPATGTGTFLVETIDLIHETMVQKWRAQDHAETAIEKLWNDYVPEHLLPRLHGYELMMAPYAIAHLKIGLKLHETGYRFENDVRAQVYLTNALEPPGKDQVVLDFLPALAHEAHAVNKIRREQRFTVVIGNPPYSGISANKAPWIDGLLKGRPSDDVQTESYYHIEGQPLGERKVWLQDDYVKFIRLSQSLLDGTGVGVHGYITNHGYLDNPTFRGMRWSLMQSFGQIRVLDLHGNVKKKEAPPDGGRDVNVFDIQQGVAVGLFTKPPPAVQEQTCDVRRADLWGERLQKYHRLLEHDTGTTAWAELGPSRPFFLFDIFDDAGVTSYYGFPPINEVMAVNVTGVVTARDGFVTDLEPQALLDRIRTFLDGRLSDTEIKENLRLKENYAWRIAAARRELRTATKRGRLEDFVAKILYRPFDERFIFWHPSVVWRPRTAAMPHLLKGKNIGLIFMRQVAMGDQYTHFGASSLPVDNRVFYSNKGIMSIAPLYLYPGVGKADRALFRQWPRGKNGRTPNLDRGFVDQIAGATKLRFASDGRGGLQQTFGPEDVIAWIYAVFHSPGYRSLYEAQLKLDFSRVPTPGSTDVFRELTVAGHDLLALHLLESPRIAETITDYAGPSTPEVGRVGWSAGTVWLDARKTLAREGHRAAQAGTIGFHGVPEEVWNFQIGGYQVCHKWLKDRKGRTLSDEDIAHYQEIVVALKETIRIMTEIDEVIETHRGWPAAFEPRAATGTVAEDAAKVLPFRPRTVDPAPEDRYVTCVPLVPLKAAAGGFSGQQLVGEDAEFEWVEVRSRHRLRPGMFVAQVVGRSMEPMISDGSWCLFRGPVEGSRQGKNVLVQLRDATDPETGQHYTVKRYRSEKKQGTEPWHHGRIALEPANPEFEPIVLSGAEEDQLQVIAEFVEVLAD